MDELDQTTPSRLDTALAENDPYAERIEPGVGGPVTADSHRRAVETRPFGSGELRPVVERDDVPRFGPGERIGRYFVLDMLGKGAMGVVVRAYDPELERTVALKAVNPRYVARHDAEEARARLLAEARAQARLSHPNVTTIHDVGTHGGHVYLAMELVDGVNLAEWLREQRRAWREVVAVFRAAAEGLAAAHEAGLVHRDVKPANILLGRDGRVRVTDFGIARQDPGSRTPSAPTVSELGPSDASLTATGMVVGTPAYMAPEQHVGGELGAAADQYALCVSLYEALYGKRPFDGAMNQMIAAKHDGKLPEPLDATVPRWLWPVVARGLRPKASERHRDLRALVAALDDDPARRRHRWLLGAGALGLAGLGVAGWIEAVSRAGPCEGAGERMAEVWSPARRQAMAGAFTASGRPYAELAFERVAQRLDERAHEWMAMRREACEATEIRREQSEALLDRRMGCLDRRLAEFDALVGVLQVADGEAVDRAPEAAGELRGLSRCADAEALQAEVAPPEDEAGREEASGIRAVLATARAQREAGHFQAAQGIAEAAGARAEALGYAPVRAEALLEQAHVLDELGRAPAAVELAKQALWAAQGVGHDQTVAEAAVLLVWLLGEPLGEPQQALDWVRHAEATLARAGADDDLRGSLWLYEGVALSRTERLDESEAAYRRALAHYRERFGDDHPAIPRALLNMANVLLLRGDNDGALAGYREALAGFEALYGPQHPRCALAHNSVGDALRFLGRLDEAEAEHQQAMALLREVQGDDHPDVAQTLLDLAHVQTLRSDLDGAERLYQDALRRLEAHPDHPLLPLALGNLGLLHADHGRPEQGLPLLQRALVLKESRVGTAHPDLIHPLGGLARAQTALGQHEAALATLGRQHALTVATFGPDDRMAAIAMADMGVALMGAGRMLEALERYRAALASFERNPHSTATDLAIALGDVGRTLVALERLDEALPVLERALALADAEDVLLSAKIDARIDLAAALLARGEDLPRARRLAEQAIALLEPLGPDGEEQQAQVRAWLAALPQR